MTEDLPPLPAVSGRRFTAMLMVSLAGHVLVVLLLAVTLSQSDQRQATRPSPSMAIDLVTPDALVLAERETAKAVPAPEADAPTSKPVKTASPDRVSDAGPQTAAATSPTPADGSSPSRTAGDPRPASATTPSADAATRVAPDSAAPGEAPEQTASGEVPDAAVPGDQPRRTPATAPDRAVIASADRPGVIETPEVVEAAGPDSATPSGRPPDAPSSPAARTLATEAPSAAEVPSPQRTTGTRVTPEHAASTRPARAAEGSDPAAATAPAPASQAALAAMPKPLSTDGPPLAKDPTAPASAQVPELEMARPAGAHSAAPAEAAASGPATAASPGPEIAPVQGVAGSAAAPVGITTAPNRAPDATDAHAAPAAATSPTTTRAGEVQAAPVRDSEAAPARAASSTAPARAPANTTPRRAAAAAASPEIASAAGPTSASADRPEVARVAPPAAASTSASPEVARTPPDVVLERLVRDMPCARAQLQGDQGARGIRLFGHVGSTGERNRILGAMREALGGGAVDATALNVVPRPHCDVLSMVADADLRADAPAASRKAGGVHKRFHAGDVVHFDVTAPSFPSYIYVDYFDRAGNVLHLRPYRRAIPDRVPPAATVTIGKGGPFRLRASPPYGTDLALVVASRTPLFDGVRPRREDAAAYLRDLKAALARAGREDGWRGAYTFLLLETTPGSLRAPSN